MQVDPLYIPSIIPQIRDQHDLIHVAQHECWVSPIGQCTNSRRTRYRSFRQGYRVGAPAWRLKYEGDKKDYPCTYIMLLAKSIRDGTPRPALHCHRRVAIVNRDLNDISLDNLRETDHKQILHRAHIWRYAHRWQTINKLMGHIKDEYPRCRFTRLGRHFRVSSEGHILMADWPDPKSYPSEYNFRVLTRSLVGRAWKGGVNPEDRVHELKYLPNLILDGFDPRKGIRFAVPVNGDVTDRRVTNLRWSDRPHSSEKAMCHAFDILQLFRDLGADGFALDAIHGVYGMHGVYIALGRRFFSLDFVRRIWSLPLPTIDTGVDKRDWDATVDAIR